MDRNALTFVATGKSGLGHLRRVTTIALALRRTRSGLDLGLLTNAVPAGIDGDELRVFDRVTQRSRLTTAATLGDHRGIVICDTVQVPGIENVAGRKVLILRETLADGAARFVVPGGWDRVIAPNPPDHWMPDARALSTSVEAAGWIVRPTGARGVDEPSAGIVIATGGGGTDATRGMLYPVLDRLIADSRARSGRAFRVRQALGPRTAGARLDGVDEAWSCL